MVNELQASEWAYLLDPCFQLVNTNGKPLTNGHIEVFYHGTRVPYYCASDWNGTLHPFKIKIDSLGSNVVLADPKFSYDVYVYNAYNVLQMSRYNVNPGVGGSGGSSVSDGEAPHWNSDPNGGASSSVTGGTTVYLTLPSSEDQPEFVDHTTDTAIFLKEGLYHIDAVVSFKQDDEDLQNIIKDLVVNTGLIGWDAQMTGQKNWTGPESTDDDRHFLELHTVVSVPEDLLQTLYFQISSPVDLDSAAIEKLDIVKLTAGGGGMTYAAGYGIDITGQVISTSGMMPESSAANFVDVSTYNTDIENIYETIAETSAMIPSGVATEQFVEDYTSAFITEDALNGYATQQWVEDQHYITSADIPPIPQDVVTSGELATVSGDIVSQIPSLDGYATQNWVGEQGYLTSIPEEYVTQTEMENYTSAFITSADLPSLDGYATEQFVEDYTSAFITSADVPQFTQEQADWNEDDTTAPDYIKNKPSIPSIEGLASEEYVQDYTSAFITSAALPDVSDMATQTWVNEQGFITSIPEDLVTSGELATVSGDIMSQIPSQTTVSIDPTLSSGTKIAEFNINGTSGELFAPQGGSSGSDVFVAEAYVTTYAEVSAAYDAGKTILAHYDGTYGGAPANATYVLSGKNTTTFYFTCTTSDLSKTVSLKTIYVSSNGWGINSNTQYAVPTAAPLTTPVGAVLTKKDSNGNIGWAAPAVSEVDIIPSLHTGTKIADYVIDGTSGELYAPAGGSTYTAGDNISIVSDTISVSGTTGLIAGENISITASGDNYVISSSGSGGGGGSEVFWAVMYQTTFQEVWDAAAAGKTVYATWDGLVPPSSAAPGFDYWRLTSIVNYDGEQIAYFERTVGNYRYLNTSIWSLNGNNDWTDISHQGVYVPQTPEVQGYVLTDNGDGTFEWAAPGGGGGLDQVYHDAGLTGSGTSASPLSITSASNWTQAYDAINASAASWNDAAGMNEYPISAGPGMSIEDVSGVTVFQTSGTMMDDLIEYNSQDEISGYNGHPVMTVDSEKQWLTHDDTIAHVTNSAQYAFGVNVPVVAQAMGTDETSLFQAASSSGQLAADVTLSESATNFEKLKILYKDRYTYSVGSLDIYTESMAFDNGAQSQFSINCTFVTSSQLYSRTTGFKFSTPTTITLQTTTQAQFKTDGTFTLGTGSGTAYHGPYIWKVVGIGRKETT